MWLFHAERSSQPDSLDPSHPSTMIEYVDVLPPFTVTLGVLGTLATGCTWLGLRRWADRAGNTRALLMVAVILWMPDVWTRWVQQETASTMLWAQEHFAGLYAPVTAAPPTTIPK